MVADTCLLLFFLELATRTQAVLTFATILATRLHNLKRVLNISNAFGAYETCFEYSTLAMCFEYLQRVRNI